MSDEQRFGPGIKWFPLLLLVTALFSVACFHWGHERGAAAEGERARKQLRHFEEMFKRMESERAGDSSRDAWPTTTASRP